ncbi:MAG: o-succinylbenzoate synthase [Chlorobium sp.]|nr:MAG: o-succinylbenzoate synthase [Chlorobium sp.]
MNVSHVLLYRYTIPLTEPVSVKGHRLRQREGIVLALKSREGDVTAYGEIAPLPGLHRETLSAAEAQLFDLLSRHEYTFSGPLPEGLFPSVRTGIEIALLNYQAAVSGNPPSIFPETEALEYLPLNALLFGDPDSIVQKAEKLFELGYRVFKLKVASGNTINALESIGILHRRFGGQIELRLDANQSFSFDEALAFARRIPEDSVSYIEEPLQDASGIGEFHARTAIKSALDETLWQRPELLYSIPSEALRALVLKPNRLGGISASLDLVRHAEKNGLQAVFSSAFESGISLCVYAWLAASSSRTPVACGLDTFRYLEHDLLESPFGSDSSMIDTRKTYLNGQRINRRALKLASIWTL